MRDIFESARVAACETTEVFCRLLIHIVWAGIVCLTAGSVMAIAYAGVRWMEPHLPNEEAVSIAAISMVLPTAAVGWFAIVFSIDLEQRRKERARNR